MANRTIGPERIQPLNDKSGNGGDYVLYWMQQSQRAEYNHALEYAVQQANAVSRPVLVIFGLMDDYPEANLRHYQFMLEGLRDAQAALAKRGIRMIVRRGQPAEVASEAGRDAAMIVCDRGYLRHQREWRAQVTRTARCSVVQVESDAVVPVGVASNKAEYAARTIRPKIHRQLDRFLVELRATPLKHDSLGRRDDGLDLGDVQKVLGKLKLDRSVEPVGDLFRGGTTEAKRRLKNFLRHRFTNYVENRNRPETDDISHMSPYLHFGQISPLYIALQIRKAGNGTPAARDAYAEELVVRRELAANFVQHTERYDTYACLPDWARRTLKAHARDRREHVYSIEELAAAETHDPYWNAAMKEMRHTGFMHNYMRMYWGKKILEWTASPEQAYETTLMLNNRYFLDGRDPSSFANVGWIFGLHDRPWQEREIFGTVRYMSAGGLKRKCDIDGYVGKVERLIA